MTGGEVPRNQNSVSVSYFIRVSRTLPVELCTEKLDRAVTQQIIDVRFEAYTAGTMKNAVFWDIKTLFVPHRKHITSPLQSPAS
jgi:hypothetical protein